MKISLFKQMYANTSKDNETNERLLTLTLEGGGGGKSAK